jgi:hypothetical protein
VGGFAEALTAAPAAGVSFIVARRDAAVLREALICRSNRSRYPGVSDGDGEEGFDATLHVYADADEVAVHSRLGGRGQASILPAHHAPLWKALGRLGQKKRRRVVPAVGASVSLWRPPLVSVERRPLGVYAVLEGRA